MSKRYSSTYDIDTLICIKCGRQFMGKEKNVKMLYRLHMKKEHNIIETKTDESSIMPFNIDNKGKEMFNKNSVSKNAKNKVKSFFEEDLFE